MKHWIVCLLLGSSFLFAEELTMEAINLDEISQTFGHLVARQLKTPGVEFNLGKVIEGIQEEMDGKAAPLTDEEFERQIAVVQENLFVQLAESNLEKATAFLKENGTDATIVSLNDQLQYKVEAEGTGSAVDDNSIPLIHYTGKLLDGTVFASSQESGQPITLPIKQTLPGFSQGLVGMKEGEKRTLYIHPELAYGVAGHLPPNSLLIFEVEVVKANSVLPEEHIASDEVEAPSIR